MSIASVGKELMVYNADVAAESAARYAAQQALGGASDASTALVKAGAGAVDVAPTLEAAKSRLTVALDRFTTVAGDRFSANGYRKKPFNEGIQNAKTAIALLESLHQRDVGLRQAAKGISSIGIARTGTWGATPNRAAQARAHVEGVLADIESGRLG